MKCEFGFKICGDIKKDMNQRGQKSAYSILPSRRKICVALNILGAYIFMI
jgi:hypothetical protein